MSAYNFKPQKLKNFHPEQHDIEISIGIGLMLILIVVTFIYFYTDTTIANYPPLKININYVTLPLHS